MQTVLEKAYKARHVTEAEVLVGFMALGRAYMCVDEWDECQACFERVMEGFVRLQGKFSTKAVGAACHLVRGAADEKIAEYRRLLEMAKFLYRTRQSLMMSQTAWVVSWMIKGQHEEAKVLWLAALEERRRFLGEEQKDTPGSLNDMGNVLADMKGHEGALDYYEQALRVQEKVLGKTHPST